MLTYYLDLGLQGLRRNSVLTALMVLAIGMGVGASMTVLTALRALSADPIPAKAMQLYSVRLDNWGPAAANNAAMSDQISYLDAAALMRAHAALRQSAMYPVQFAVTPPDSNAVPFTATGRAVYTDFFAMFDAPFAAGGPWSRVEDETHANVVVLGAVAAARLFPSGEVVGRTLALDGHDYRVVGVLRPWHFQPRVYDLTSRLYQKTEDIFLPLSTAVDQQMDTRGGISCPRPVTPGFAHEVLSECRWLQFWVELPTPAAMAAYRGFLYRYADQQRDIGRFHWAPAVSLLNVPQTLAAEHMVPDEMRISTLTAFGFLLVCVLNATGLMLAQLRQRVMEFSVRRALGAARWQIFCQCLAEGALVGIGGGLLGLGLTMAGLAFERAILREDYAGLIQLNANAALMALVLALAAMVCAALLPGWDASRRQPAWLLKVE